LGVSGSLVFTPTKRRVPLTDEAQWWRWMPGANWREPEGPGSTIAGKDEHPVVHISYDDALAYAGWAGKRLPSEAEWEYAARGGLDHRRYVWGNEFMPGGRRMANTWQGWFPVVNTGDDGFAGTAPVKSFPPNGYGLYDMAGNAWQWSSDRFDPQSDRRVIKGGSFLCSPIFCASYRPSARQGADPLSSASHIGFRLAMSAESK
jgi:formylglycine-generating enzyme required for sulfatase activity